MIIINVSVTEVRRMVNFIDELAEFAPGERLIKDKDGNWVDLYRVRFRRINTMWGRLRKMYNISEYRYIALDVRKRQLLIY